MTNAELLGKLTPYGQQHLLAFWERLAPADRDQLGAQISKIDFGLLEKLYRARNDQGDIRELAGRAAPPPAIRLNSASNKFTPEQAKARAIEALKAGEIGAILVAGGQGTRLGFDHPKGMYKIGPVSDRTLFEIHVSKIVAASKRYGVRIPLYLMTSPATHAETVEYFKQNDRFGLAEEDLIIFCQGTMPAVDKATGQVLLETPSKIAVSPDGHGGMLAAMKTSGALADIARRGVKHLFYFQVDNPLVDICGTEFLGYHLLADSELSSQVIAKQNPLDRVGNIVEVDGKLIVIEYSDLPNDIAELRNADGSLQIWAGSIAVHVMAATMLNRLADSAAGLPFHLAYKKVPFVDATGATVKPSEPNAIKFERFIFDLMPEAKNAIVVEIDPNEGFGPLKNASGAPSDTPEMVRSMLSDQHRRWLEAAGVKVADGTFVEIDPLFALDATETAAKVKAGTTVTTPTFFK